MKRQKQTRRKKGKKSMFDFDLNELNDSLAFIPEVIFLIFMIWFGYSIIFSQNKNEIYQKFLKKSLIQGRKHIDDYFPGLLASDAIFNIFDYDVLFIKTKEFITILGGLYIVGAIMSLVFSTGGRKIILFFTLILDLAFIHNLIYYREGNLYDIIVIFGFIIILFFLKNA